MCNRRDSLMSRALDSVSFVLPNRRVRMDGAGSGDFASSRGGRLHKGVDFEFAYNEEVPSPVTGTVVRIGHCYADDLSYRLVEILTHNQLALVRLLYVRPLVGKNQFVNEGDIIGTAQNIAARHGPPMKNHVHIEVNIDPRILKGGSIEEDDTLPGGDPLTRTV